MSSNYKVNKNIKIFCEIICTYHLHIIFIIWIPLFDSRQILCMLSFDCNGMMIASIVFECERKAFSGPNTCSEGGCAKINFRRIDAMVTKLIPQHDIHILRLLSKGGDQILKTLCRVHIFVQQQPPSEQIHKCAPCTGF